jgi:hypothetical protein
MGRSRGDEASADTVSEEWVRMIAAIRDDQDRGPAAAVDARGPTSIASLWQSRPRPCGVAIRELIALCRESVARGLQVVHTWSL